MKKNKRSLASLQLGKPAILINYILLIVFCFIVVFPLLTILNTSFKTGTEYLNSSAFALPKKFTFDNYIKALANGGFFLAFKNTGILVACGVIGSVSMGLGASYVLDRFKFRGKRIILNAFLFALVIPTATIQVSIFPIIRDLGLYNTIGAGIVLYLATDVLQLYIFLQYMEKISVSLDESARIDGATYLTILLKVIIPQMVPAIITVILIKGLTIYNDMLLQVLYMSSLDLRTVSTALMKFFYQKDMQWPVMMSAVVVAMTPTLILYFVAQKYIVSGAMAGSVKG